MDRGKWDELFKPYSVFGGELLITKLGEPPGVCASFVLMRQRGISEALAHDHHFEQARFTALLRLLTGT